jgi:hypothetical protein
LVAYRGGDLVNSLVRCTDQIGENFTLSEVEWLLNEHGLLEHFHASSLVTTISSKSVGFVANSSTTTAGSVHQKMMNKNHHHHDRQGVNSSDDRVVVLPPVYQYADDTYEDDDDYNQDEEDSDALGVD